MSKPTTRTFVEPWEGGAPRGLAFKDAIFKLHMRRTSCSMGGGMFVIRNDYGFRMHAWRVHGIGKRT